MAIFQPSGPTWRLDLNSEEVLEFIQLEREKGGSHFLLKLLGPDGKNTIPAIQTVASHFDLQNELSGQRGVTITGTTDPEETLIGPPGFPELHAQDQIPGSVFADRSAMGPWESFWMEGAGRGVSRWHSWQGYFSAQPDGSVYANRSVVGEWEVWHMFFNDDHTLSARSNKFNLYFSAEQGGGDRCNANRTSIGDWEKFEVVHSGAYFGMKTISKGLFVSVQP